MDPIESKPCAGCGLLPDQPVVHYVGVDCREYQRVSAIDPDDEDGPEMSRRPSVNCMFCFLSALSRAERSSLTYLSPLRQIRDLVLKSRSGIAWADVPRAVDEALQQARAGEAPRFATAIDALQKAQQDSRTAVATDVQQLLDEAARTLAVRYLAGAGCAATSKPKAS